MADSRSGIKENKKFSPCVNNNGEIKSHGKGRYCRHLATLSVHKANVGIEAVLMPFIWSVETVENESALYSVFLPFLRKSTNSTNTEIKPATA